MAYGVKYRFQCESYNGVTYRVDLLEDGYSGAVTTRPLGKAPVLRMQEADPFRSTSCDLVLECQSDGEYVDLYTTDPFHFKVEVQSVEGNGTWNIWRGFVPTEIYSEPDIAPPYDVKITATDGIGLLKEYTFEAVGAKSIRDHICDLLEKTGDDAPMFYYATMLSKYQGSEVDFMDDALINLDYMAGESCYDVLKYILVSLRSVLMYRGTHWLIIREVDVQMSSDGMLTAVECITSNPYYVPYSTTVKEGMTVGKMGVADMWPVGYLTRRVVPAKKSVHVKAPWHYVNGYPKVSANGWTVDGNATFDSTNKIYHIGTRSQSYATGLGSVRSSKTLFRFVDNFKVAIKANAHSMSGVGAEVDHYVRVDASWAPISGGGTYYWSSKYGWNDDSSSTGEEVSVEETNVSYDPNACKIVEVLFPPVPDDNTGLLTVKVYGALVDVYDIEVLPATVAGYEDRIFIDNGARGEAGTIDVFGGRLMSSNFINLDFYQGIFFHTDGQASGPDTQFSDLMNIGKDFMTLTALAYAMEVAAPRIEITGKLNNKYVPTIGMPAPFIKSHGVWALLKNYDWDLVTEDVSFSAVSLPSVALTVEDEVITSIAPDGGISGGASSSGGSGGGGGGGGSYTLPIASANTLGGVRVGSGLSIDQDGVLSSQGGGGGYTLPAASSGALGGIKIGYTQNQKNYPVQLDSNNKAYVNVPWEGGGSGGGGTVTSVGMTVPTGFSVTGSPVTGSGTLAVSLDSQAKNKVLASPANASGTPSFRALVAADIPDLSGKYVTLDTTQNNISGEKTFTTKPVHIAATSGIDVNGNSYIDIGEVRLVYDSTNKALHITTKSGNETIGLYADGFVSARGAAASGDQIKFVTLTGAQSVDGIKTFLANIIANGTITINGVTLTGSSSKLSLNKNASFAGISDRVNGSNTTHEVSIQDIVNRLVALENA